MKEQRAGSPMKVVKHEKLQSLLLSGTSTLPEALAQASAPFSSTAHRTSYAKNLAPVPEAWHF